MFNSQIANFKHYSRKLFILAALLITLAAAYWVQKYLRTDIRQLNLPPVSIQEIVDAEPIQQSSDSAIGNPMVPNTAASILPESKQLDLEIETPKPAYLSVLEEIRTEIKQQHEAFLYFDDRLQPVREMLPNLQSAITVQSAATKRIEQRMLELENQLAGVFATIDEAKANDSDTPHRSPPFRLIAVDRWNNEWNAVIELDGKIAMISPQSSRAGWLLVKVDPDAQMAVFRASTGEQISLKVSG